MNLRNATTAHVPAVGSRVMADLVFAWPGQTSREQVVVERILDEETLLVKVEASIATPSILIGQAVAIPVGMVRSYVNIFDPKGGAR